MTSKRTKAKKSGRRRTRHDSVVGTKGSSRAAPPSGVDYIDRAMAEHAVAPSIDQQGLSASVPALQAKLRVGPAGDRYEREADRMAGDVMQHLRRQDSEEPRSVRGPRLQRLTAQSEVLPEGRRVEPVVGMEGGLLDAGTDTAIRQSKGRGKPLPADLRRSMEGAFGSDFSDVRVHDDPGAHELNDKLQAKAFTTGGDIFVEKGAYSPVTREGQKLVAHELTHVVQQGISSTSESVSRQPDPSPSLQGDWEMDPKEKASFEAGVYQHPVGQERSVFYRLQEDDTQTESKYFAQWDKRLDDIIASPADGNIFVVREHDRDRLAVRIDWVKEWEFLVLYEAKNDDEIATSYVGWTKSQQDEDGTVYQGGGIQYVFNAPLNKIEAYPIVESRLVGA